MAVFGLSWAQNGPGAGRSVLGAPGVPKEGVATRFFLHDMNVLHEIHIVFKRKKFGREKVFRPYRGDLLGHVWGWVVPLAGRLGAGRSVFGAPGVPKEGVAARFFLHDMNVLHEIHVVFKRKKFGREKVFRPYRGDLLGLG